MCFHQADTFICKIDISISKPWGQQGQNNKTECKMHLMLSAVPPEFLQFRQASSIARRYISAYKANTILISIIIWWDIWPQTQISQTQNSIKKTISVLERHYNWTIDLTATLRHCSYVQPLKFMLVRQPETTKLCWGQESPEMVSLSTVLWTVLSCTSMTDY